MPWVLVALGLCSGAALWATAPADPDGPWAVPFVRGYMIAWLCYLAAAVLATRAVRLPRWALAWIVAAALGLRLIALERTHPLSTDYWRYLWDGRLINAGVNPYRYRPDAPALRHLRDANWRRLSFKYIPAIYPPAAELLFAGIACLRSRDAEAFRWSSLGFDMASILVLIALLLRTGRPAERVVWYAWCPLPVAETSAGAHVDAFGLFLLLVALLLAARSQGRPGPASALALAGAIFAKGFAALTVPFFVRRGGWRVLVLVAAACLVMLAPFVGSGLHLFGGVSEYFAHWETNSSLFSLSHWSLAALGLPDNYAYYITRALSTAAILVAVAWLAVRQGPGTEGLLRATFLALASCLLLGAPTLPWYVIWALPLLCWWPIPGGVLLTLTVSTQYYLRWAYGDRYHLLLWIEYLPVYALLIGQFVWWRGRAPGPRGRAGMFSSGAPRSAATTAGGKPWRG